MLRELEQQDVVCQALRKVVEFFVCIYRKERGYLRSYLPKFPFNDRCKVTLVNEVTLV